jgi:rubredoxin
MNMSKTECPDCKLQMETGFIHDEVYGGRKPASWISGEPEKSIWVGVKLKGKVRKVITSYRCPSCGYVKMYATGESS